MPYLLLIPLPAWAEDVTFGMDEARKASEFAMASESPFDLIGKWRTGGAHRFAFQITFGEICRRAR